MQVRCGECGRTVRVAQAESTEQITCPDCGHAIVVPGIDATGQSVPADDAPAPAEGFAAKARQVIAKKVRVTCGSCGRSLRVGGRALGKKARCPSCNAVIRVPYPQEDEELVFARAEDSEEDVFEPDVDNGQVELAELYDGDTVAASAEAGGTNRRALWWWLIAAVLFVAIAAWAVWLVLHASSPQEPPPQVTPSSAPAVAVKTRQPKTTPAGKVPTPPVVKVTPPEPVGAFRVLSVTKGIFLADGYIPAGIGSIYWFVELEISTDDRPLVLRSFGEAAVLKADGGEYVSAGLKPPGAAAPPFIERKTLMVASSDSLRVTLAFELPSSVRRGILRLTGVGGRAEVAPGSGAAMADKPPQAGRYGETPPRNLKPMLRGPIISAIQSAGRHELIIAAAEKGMLVSIPAAGVKGTATGDDGILNVTLKKGSHSRKAWIRSAGGNKIILYLKDEPYHQLTYVKK